jgi:LmbE family N-acetylglucosaminyl deacetylase
MRRMNILIISVILLLVFGYGCGDDSGESLSRCPAVPQDTPIPPTPPACDNNTLTEYDELLLIGPHPDDEVLGFSGLESEFIRLNKPVSIVVVTDGAAYCDACSFWVFAGVMNPLAEWGQCTEADLERFADQRMNESKNAQNILGGPVPIFWDYPNGGIAVSWEAIKSGVGMDTPLRRADCTKGGRDEGSATDFTPTTLYNQLKELISNSPPRTLIGTTHPLDGHDDHEGLGKLIMKINEEFSSDGDPATIPKSVAFRVIHAHSDLDGQFHDCWYPSPSAVVCGCGYSNLGRRYCYLSDTTLIERLRGYRYRPEWSIILPSDIDYLTPVPNSSQVSFCLPKSLYEGKSATKLLAIEAFETQIGLIVETGTIPDGLSGLVDGFGYLTAFVKSNEIFVYVNNLDDGT